MPKCPHAILLTVTAALALPACQLVAAPRPGTAEPQVSGQVVRLEAYGVTNLWSLGGRLLCGSAPEGERGLRALADLGVVTLLSVDGARPDVEGAERLGMRYVHLPVGYDGIPRSQALAIARAVSDLPGPIFIHCHHGLHRSPAAAATALMVRYGWSNERAVALMQRLGTSQDYVGLFGDVEAFVPPTRSELAAADSSFPAVSRVPPLATAMLAVDHTFENLADVREAGWATPPRHPDLDPAHEALQLRERFAELARSEEGRARPEGFRSSLASAEQAAADLETILRGDSRGADAEAAWQRVGAACASCHSSWRDAPPGR